MKIQKQWWWFVDNNDYDVSWKLCSYDKDEAHEGGDDGNGHGGNGHDGGSRVGSPYVARVLGFPGSQQCPLQSKSVKIPSELSL